MRRVRALAALLLGSLAGSHWGGSASAQTALEMFDDTVRVEAETLWPQEVQSGWVPIQVRVRNDGDRRRSFDLALVSEQWRNSEVGVRRRIEIEAGERLEFEDLVPIVPIHQHSFVLEAQVGSTYWWGGQGLDTAMPDSDLRSVLLLRGVDVPPTTRVQWEADLNETSMRSFSLAVVPWDRASARVDAYSSLDLVLLSAEDGLPPPEVGAALRAWVLQGGRLGVFGPDKELALEALGLDVWLEPRFQDWTGPDLPSWSAGHGRIHVLQDSAETELGHLPGARAWAIHLSDWPRTGQSDLRAGWTDKTHRWFVVPGVDDLPYRAFLLLLLLFAIVIGPVNFFVVQRVWKRPPLLLATIPVVALAATCGVLLFGVFSQGVDVRDASVSVTVLDQREHTSATLERRTFFAGLAPAAGLSPGAGTTVLIEPDPTLSNEGRFQSLPGLAEPLRGEYLPARRVARQALATTRSSRLRLAFEADGEDLTVANGLGVRVLGLLVHDEEGSWYQLDEPLETDAGARLVPVVRGAGAEALVAVVREAAQGQLKGIRDRLTSTRLDLAPLDELEGLWRGGYVAVLASDPFRDDCGVDARTVAGAHLVFGVLPVTGSEDPEEGR